MNDDARNCDECGAESPYRNGVQPFICWQCKKHLCDLCIVWPRHVCALGAGLLMKGQER